MLKVTKMLILHDVQQAGIAAGGIFYNNNWRKFSEG
jgi:hypothetical protein